MGFEVNNRRSMSEMKHNDRQGHLITEITGVEGQRLSLQWHHRPLDALPDNKDTSYSMTINYCALSDLRIAQEQVYHLLMLRVLLSALPPSTHLSKKG